MRFDIEYKEDMIGFEKYKNKLINIIILFVAGAITFSELMVNQLVNNYDGLWEYNFHNAGAWELSIGRWFWLYLSRLRFGLATDPGTSLVSIALFSAGIVLVTETLEVNNRFVAVLSGLLFICTPAVCADLSYRYMSPTFATSFLLSILAVWCVVKIKRTWLGVACGTACIALSLGAYQAFIGCTCVLTLVWFVKKLLGDENVKGILMGFCHIVCSVFLGGVVYWGMLKLHQLVLGVSQADYMGGDSFSILNAIKNLPVSFQLAFMNARQIYGGVSFKTSRLDGIHICLIVFICLGICFAVEVVKKVKEKRIINAVLIILALLLLVPACYAANFMAVDAGVSAQMMASWFIVVPALVCALPLEFDYISGKLKTIGSLIISIILVVSLWGSFYQTQFDQNTMHEGRNSTVKMADLILNELADLDYLSDEYCYCFIGSASENPLYYLSANGSANMYATFGAFWDGYSSVKSWKGVVNDMMGVNIRFAEWDEFALAVNSEEYAEMSTFPKEGSIIKLDDIIVVKVSE